MQVAGQAHGQNVLDQMPTSGGVAGFDDAIAVRRVGADGTIETIAARHPPLNSWDWGVAVQHGDGPLRQGIVEGDEPFASVLRNGAETLQRTVANVGHPVDLGEGAAAMDALPGSQLIHASSGGGALTRLVSEPRDLGLADAILAHLA